MTTSMRIFAVTVSFAALLSGCSSSSMRVEVQVYKGPLSKEFSLQKGELLGVLEASHTHLSAYLKEVDGLIEKVCQDCTEADVYDKDKAVCRVSAKANAARIAGQKLVNRLACVAGKLKNCSQTTCASPDPATNKSECPDPDFNTLQPVLVEVAALSMAMKQAAIGAAYQLDVWSPQNDIVRIHLANAANLLAESSNQLSSRADALLKQLGTDDRQTTPAESLAQSVYLRDSAPTSFLNMYAWDSAMKPPLSEDADAHYFEREERTDRVRALEHHFADHYWSTINSVVASGAGKVGMALVKDDIGNWNLKNFETDPTEMIQAYKQVGIAALKAAQTLIEPAASGIEHISNAKKFLALANQFNFSSQPEGGGSLDGLVSNVSLATAGGLKALAEEMRVKPGALDAEIAKKKEAATDASLSDAVQQCSTATQATVDDIWNGSGQDAHAVLGKIPAGIPSSTAGQALASAKQALTFSPAWGELTGLLTTAKSVTDQFTQEMQGVADKTRAGVGTPDKLTAARSAADSAHKAAERVGGGVSKLQEKLTGLNKSVTDAGGNATVIDKGDQAVAAAQVLIKQANDCLKGLNAQSPTDAECLVGGANGTALAGKLEAIRTNLADVKTACVVAKLSRMEADKAKRRLEAYQLEDEKAKLPQTAQTRAKELLDAQEQTVVALMKSAVAKPAAQTGGASALALPAK